MTESVSLMIVFVACLVYITRTGDALLPNMSVEKVQLDHHMAVLAEVVITMALVVLLYLYRRETVLLVIFGLFLGEHIRQLTMKFTTKGGSVRAYATLAIHFTGFCYAVHRGFVPAAGAFFIGILIHGVSCVTGKSTYMPIARA